MRARKYTPGGNNYRSSQYNRIQAEARAEAKRREEERKRWNKRLY